MKAKNIHPIVGQIVDRCHVSDTYEEVLEYFISRLAKGQKTWDAMSKKDRREVEAQVNLRHEINRKQYRAVMTGRF